MKCPNCGNEVIVKKDSGMLYCCACNFEWEEYDTACWKIYFEEIRE